MSSIASKNRYYASASAAEDQPQRVSYTYDALGRTATLTDPRGTTTYTYDGEGRETQVASPEGTINYVYGTAAGNGKDRLIRTYTAHDDQSYTYDALGRLASVTANVIRGVTLNEAGSYAYDLNGNLRSWSLTGRATALHIYSYDELNRLTTLTRQNFTEPMTWNYATDKTGRKTTDGAKFRWEYDALGRLTREQYDANTNWTLDSANDYITTFAYDLVGNRKKKVTDKLGTASDETITYVYNSRDELTSETSTLSGSTTYVYDANGSLTSKTKGAAVETYGYDKRNKMTSYTSSAGVTTTYKYDDEGLRVQRKVGTNPTTLYLLNHHNLTGYPVVMEERSSTSTSMPTVAYVVGHDVVRQSQDAAGTGTTDGHLHLVYDGQGNMRGNVGTISAGPTTIFATVGGTRDYTAFGELISGSLVSNLRHHGEYFDGITGFYFQGVRQRATFAWMQDDDYQGNKQYPLTLHKRGFVHQDPINGIDPSGNLSQSELMVVGLGLVILDAIMYIRSRGIIAYQRPTRDTYTRMPYISGTETAAVRNPTAIASDGKNKTVVVLSGDVTGRTRNFWLWRYSLYVDSALARGDVVDGYPEGASRMQFQQIILDSTVRNIVVIGHGPQNWGDSDMAGVDIGPNVNQDWLFSGDVKRWRNGVDMNLNLVVIVGCFQGTNDNRNAWREAFGVPASKFAASRYKDYWWNASPEPSDD